MPHLLVNKELEKCRSYLNSCHILAVNSSHISLLVLFFNRILSNAAVGKNNFVARRVVILKTRSNESSSSLNK